MNSYYLKKSLALVSLFLFMQVFCYGQTWNGSVSKNWNDPANWTPNEVPTTSSNVTINALTTNWPTLQGTVTIASLTQSADTLDLNGNSLICSGTLDLRGGGITTGTIQSGTGFINAILVKGNLTLSVDSSHVLQITNSIFKGANNIFTAGYFNEFSNNVLGQTGKGTTTLNSLLNSSSKVSSYEGKNKFMNDLKILIYAPVASGGNWFYQGSYAGDTIMGNATIKLQGNTQLLMASNSNQNYIAGNFIIDAANGQPGISFTDSLTVNGNFIGQNFSSNHNLFTLNNLTVKGTAPTDLQCGSGNINNCNFCENFTMLVDSNSNYTLQNNNFKGASNTITAGYFGRFENNVFGQTGTGITTLNSLLTSQGNVVWNEGNNRFLNNLNMVIYAPVESYGNKLQMGGFGQDTVNGNAFIKLQGNSHLRIGSVTNQNYIAGNFTLDAANTQPSIYITSVTVGGNFAGQNFLSNHNLFALENFNVNGTGPTGRFQCGSGSIVHCNFNGNFTMAVDPDSGYIIQGNNFKGSNNTFSAGYFPQLAQNVFGKTNVGTTTFNSMLTSADTADWAEGDNKFLNDVNLSVNSSNSSGLNRFHHGVSGGDTTIGNFTITANGNSTAILNKDYIGGNVSLNNNGKGSIAQQDLTSRMTLYGNDTATYNYTGTIPGIKNISINKNGGLKLLSPLIIDNNTTFSKGVFLTDSVNVLTFANSATAMGAGDSSYVNGFVKKTGANAFTFPLGNTLYAPLSITAPATATDAFMATYIYKQPGADGYDTASKASTLDHLSGKEYWKLDRIEGNSNVSVTLSWKAGRSGTVVNISNLRVARWNGTKWLDEGQANPMGTNLSGTIQTASAITSYSPFTLASTSLDNVLPITLTSFTAQLIREIVNLQWITASELNNNYFELERSTDDISFAPIAKISGRGNSSVKNIYQFTDSHPISGTNYYRLKQVDYDGHFTFSNIIVIVYKGTKELFRLYPNPATDAVNITLGGVNNGSSIINVYDEAGKLIRSRNIHGNSTNVQINIKTLPIGVYEVECKNGKDLQVLKMIKH